MGYADDLTLICTDFEDASQTLERLLQELSRIGLSINPLKCYAMCLQSNGEVDLSQQFVIHETEGKWEVSVEEKEYSRAESTSVIQSVPRLTILGQLLTFSETERTQEFERNVDDNEMLIEDMRELFRQNQLLLARNCISNRMGYYLRTQPIPTLHLRRYDSVIQEALAQNLNLAPDIHPELMSQSFKNGGLAMFSLEQTQKASIVGLWNQLRQNALIERLRIMIDQQTTYQLLPMDGQDLIHEGQVKITSTVTIYNGIIRGLNDEERQALEAETQHGIWEKEMDNIYQTIRDNLKERDPHCYITNGQLARDITASVNLRTPPGLSFQRLSDEAVTSLLNRRLGGTSEADALLKAFQSNSQSCPLCKWKKDKCHSTVCHKTSTGINSTRHNLICRLIASLVANIPGSRVKCEPYDQAERIQQTTGAKSKAVADINFTFCDPARKITSFERNVLGILSRTSLEVSFQVDVTVVSAHTTTDQQANLDGKTLELAVARKNAKYAESNQQKGVHIIPLAVTEDCEFHSLWHQFTDFLIEIGKRNGVEVPVRNLYIEIVNLITTARYETEQLMVQALRHKMNDSSTFAARRQDAKLGQRITRGLRAKRSWKPSAFWERELAMASEPNPGVRDVSYQELLKKEADWWRYPKPSDTEAQLSREKASEPLEKKGKPRAKKRKRRRRRGRCRAETEDSQSSCSSSDSYSQSLSLRSRDEAARRRRIEEEDLSDDGETKYKQLITTPPLAKDLPKDSTATATFSQSPGEASGSLTPARESDRLST